MSFPCCRITLRNLLPRKPIHQQKKAPLLRRVKPVAWKHMCDDRFILSIFYELFPNISSDFIGFKLVCLLLISVWLPQIKRKLNFLFKKAIPESSSAACVPRGLIGCLVIQFSSRNIFIQTNASEFDCRKCENGIRLRGSFSLNEWLIEVAPSLNKMGHSRPSGIRGDPRKFDVMCVCREPLEPDIDFKCHYISSHIWNIRSKSFKMSRNQEQGFPHTKSHLSARNQITLTRFILQLNW